MSFISSWSYREGPLTVWPSGGTDEFGVPQHAPPYLIPAIDYILGGEVGRDENGTEFTPAITVWFETDGSLAPERDWYIKIGDHLGEAIPPPDAERIKSVIKYPMAKFGSTQIPDWEVKA